jgi:hypothetical protein
MVKIGFCSFTAIFHANSNVRARKAMPLLDSEQRVRIVRVFDTGNDLDNTTTFTTGFYFDIEHTLQSLCPSHWGLLANMKRSVNDLVK